MLTTLQLPALNARALFTPDSWNPETNEVRLEWGSEAAILTIDEWTGEPFDEVLSFDPAHVRLERLNNGASVLDSHGRSENRFGSTPLSYRLGGVLRAWSEGGRGLADIRLLDVPKTAEVRKSFEQGIPPGVSVGYRVFAYRDVTQPGDVRPRMMAVDWEPYEITLTPIPADAGLRFRSADNNRNPCTLEIMSGTKPKTPTGDTPNPPQAEVVERVRSLFQKAGTLFAADEIELLIPQLDEDKARALIEARRATLAAATAPTAAPADGARGLTDPAAAGSGSGEQPEQPEQAQQAERARTLGILELGRTHDLPGDFTTEHVRTGTTLERFRTLTLERLAGGQSNMNTQNGPLAHVGEEDQTKRLGAMGRALLHRFGGQAAIDADTGRQVELDAGARHFRSMPLLGLASECIRMRGGNADGLTAETLLTQGRSLGLGTSDFASLLGNTANKALLREFNAEPQPWRQFASRGDAKDFKTLSRHKLGDAPSLLEVGENGEVELGKMSEETEQYAVTTGARRLVLTRKALVNDDLGAFSRLIRGGARAARRRENATVWGLFTANPVMGDGVALFHASHNNLGTGAITVANVGAGVKAMMNQRGVLNGDNEGDFLEIRPAFLIVPTSLYTVAQQFVSGLLQPATQTEVNPYKDLIPIASARLDADDAAAWYLAGSPMNADVIEYAYLDGFEGPQLQVNENANGSLGIEYLFWHDFGAAALDHRGLYKSSGS